MIRTQIMELNYFVLDYGDDISQPHNEFYSKTMEIFYQIF